MAARQRHNVSIYCVRPPEFGSTASPLHHCFSGPEQKDREMEVRLQRIGVAGRTDIAEDCPRLTLSPSASPSA